MYCLATRIIAVSLCVSEHVPGSHTDRRHFSMIFGKLKSFSYQRICSPAPDQTCRSLVLPLSSTEQRAVDAGSEQAHQRERARSGAVCWRGARGQRWGQSAADVQPGATYLSNLARGKQCVSAGGVRCNARFWS